MWQCLVCVLSPRHLEGTEPSLGSPGERRLRRSPRCGPESERCLRIPIPPEAGLRSREHADLSPQVALLRTRVREDTSGTYPRTRGAPLTAHPLRAAQPRRCGVRRAPHGHRAAAFPSVLVWGIAVFSLLTSGPEAQRGGEPRGAPLRRGPPAPVRGPGGAGRELRGVRPPPRGPGAAESPPCGSAGPVISEVPREIGESFIFTCALNVIGAAERKGTLVRAWEAWMQPCKMCH